MPLRITNKMSAECYLDDLNDQFEEGYYLEDVQEDVKQHIPEFIKYGVDIQLVIKLMNPCDVFKSYGTLVKAGAAIDPTDLAMRMDDDFVYTHLSELGAIGVNLNKVFPAKCGDAFLSECSKLFDGEFEQFAKKLFDAGVSASAVFKVYESFMDDAMYDDSEFKFSLPILQFFIANGMSQSLAVNWLSKWLNHGRIYNVFNSAELAQKIKSIGVNLEDFIDNYIDHCIDWSKSIEDMLIDAKQNSVEIPTFADRIAEHLTREMLNGWYIGDIIDDFLSAGGHIEVLAKRFVEVVGYTGGEWDVKDLIEIIRYNDACEVVDFTKFAESVNPDVFDEEDEFITEDLEFLYNRCIEHGVSPELLQKLKK